MKVKKHSTLPLGVDFGRNRVRVALTEFDDTGRRTLAAVAAREIVDEPARALCEAVSELRTDERRCVIGIGHPDAVLRPITLPPMSRLERTKAARYQALRFIDYPVEQAAISIVPLDGTRWTIGIARRDALRTRVLAAKRAKLTTLAIDDNAFALKRLSLDTDATLDVSDDRTLVTMFGPPIPLVAHVPIGARFFTEGIAGSLGIDVQAAEERKRTIGFAGAGEIQRDEWIHAVARALVTMRAANQAELRRLLFVGNGSRIPGLPEAFARATGYGTQLAALGVDISNTLPPDVLRAAGADWAIAYGLSLWERSR